MATSGVEIYTAFVTHYLFMQCPFSVKYKPIIIRIIPFNE